MKAGLRDRMRRRTMWRKRAHQAAKLMIAAANSSCTADSHRPDLARAAAKVEQWFGRRGGAVMRAIQRRVLGTIHEPA